MVKTVDNPDEAGNMNRQNYKRCQRYQRKRRNKPKGQLAVNSRAFRFLEPMLSPIVHEQVKVCDEDFPADNGIENCVPLK
mmetsp:Transcript_119821/g.238593  ORF Transcript_119821/g.238593 Transcript_119821/m.238593 type:complete len:80 (-) Transcript_119821:394-633(-)